MLWTPPLARQPFRAAKAVRRTALAGVNIRRRNRQPDTIPPPAPFSAPHTPFNVSIDARRRFAFTEIPLDEAQMVKNALGGTVNDVVLALCAGALRNYLLGKGVLPEKGLVAMVPISVRTDDQKGDMGNRVSSIETIAFGDSGESTVSAELVEHLTALVADRM